MQNTNKNKKLENKSKQTILGAGGAIGVELAKALTQYTDQIRLVSRNPQKVNPGDELIAADLLNSDAIKRAVKGSSVVYVTIGFPYNYKFWKTHWPDFIQTVVDTCIEEKCKLVFFDNIYMYDPDHLNGMTEETPVRPTSKKGKIREEVAEIILSKVREGKLTALIARSADFYGPGIKNSSLLNETVIKPLKAGKKANWMGSVNCKHSYTYTPDAGKATAILGNTDSAYGQVWHLPTTGNPLTGKEIIELCAKELGVKSRFQTLSNFMIYLIGIFVPVMREFPEMSYQYDRDYVFNSHKFEKAFNFKPTTYADGIREVIKRDFS